jgi:MoaA/NifB/PqqE/SkfB family radical SAM enzyme
MLPEIKYLKKIACSNFMRLDFPHKISYAVTYRCNLRCKMCHIWGKKPVEELSLDQVERFFAKSNRFSWVGITGGEPFLREDIAEVVKIIIDHCPDLTAVHFATNGTMTNKIGASVEKILAHRKVKLLFTLSIDGPSSLHDEIRGVEGTWLKCVATFKRLRAMKSVQARIGTTLSHLNFDKFHETFLALKEVYPLLRFDDFTINIFHRSSLYYENTALPELDRANIIKAIEKILELDKDSFTLNNFLRRRYLKLYKKYAHSNKCPLRCQALSSSCLLEPQGDIYPCGIFPQRIANVLEHDYDLEKIWSLPATKNLSMKCMRSECPSCWTPCDAYSAIAGSLGRFDLWR